MKKPPTSPTNTPPTPPENKSKTLMHRIVPLPTYRSNPGRARRSARAAIATKVGSFPKASFTSQNPVNFNTGSAAHMACHAARKPYAGGHRRAATVSARAAGTRTMPTLDIRYTRLLPPTCSVWSAVASAPLFRKPAMPSRPQIKKSPPYAPSNPPHLP
jgi:hypothetical protein